MAKTKAGVQSSCPGSAAPATKPSVVETSKKSGLEAGAHRPDIMAMSETDKESGNSKPTTTTSTTMTTNEGQISKDSCYQHTNNAKSNPDARHHIPSIIKTTDDSGDNSFSEPPSFQKDSLDKASQSRLNVSEVSHDFEENAEENFPFVPYQRQSSASFKAFILALSATLAKKAQVQVRNARQHPKLTVAFMLLLMVSWPAIIGFCLVAGVIGLVASLWITVILAFLGIVVSGVVFSIAWVFVLLLGAMAVLTIARRAYRSWTIPADAA